MNRRHKWYFALGVFLTIVGFGMVLTGRAGKITTPTIEGLQAILLGISTMLIGLWIVFWAIKR